MRLPFADTKAIRRTSAGDVDPDGDAKNEDELRLLRLLKARLSSQYRETLDRLGWPPDLNRLDSEFWASASGLMIADLRPELERMAMASIASTVSPSVPIVWDEAVIAREAADWATTYTYELVRGIQDNTRQLLQRVVPEFVRTPGMTIGQLRAEITPAFGERRAQAIAVTETTRAYAEGKRQVQSELAHAGIRMTRIWRTSMDERVCPICSALADKPESEWNNSGPPAHPNCILPGNIVVAPGGVQVATKSLYVGRAVEITLANGSRLTVTQNHPVLTGHGWLAAKLLRKGDEVVYCAQPERIATAIQPNDGQVPTVIEEVYSALEKSFAMSAHAVPAAPEDLHGEGAYIQGDIHVIRANRQLLRNAEAACAQHVGEHVLSHRDVGPFLLDAKGLGAEELLGLGSTTDGVVGGRDHGGALFGRGALPTQEHAVGDIARGDAGGKNALPEGPTIDPGLAREFLLRFAGDVALQQIVKIRDLDFSGHVYDLQSDLYELYIASGVVVHNCRCWTILSRLRD